MTGRKCRVCMDALTVEVTHVSNMQKEWSVMSDMGSVMSDGEMSVVSVMIDRGMSVVSDELIKAGEKSLQT